MNRRTAMALALLLTRSMGWADSFRFEPGCPLPYEAIKQARPTLEDRAAP